MQGFLLSIRVVTPILLMLGVGMLVRRLGWVDEKSLNVMDRLGFKLLLPTQLFYSLYRAEWDISVYGKPLLASIVIILIILVLVGLVVIFKNQITRIVNNIFNKITAQTGKI